MRGCQVTGAQNWTSPGVGLSAPDTELKWRFCIFVRKKLPDMRFEPAILRVYTGYPRMHLWISTPPLYWLCQYMPSCARVCLDLCVWAGGGGGGLGENHVKEHTSMGQQGQLSCVCGGGAGGGITISKPGSGQSA